MQDDCSDRNLPEPTLAEAQTWWSAMRQPVSFPGVPGYPWQPAVLWNTGLVFFPDFHPFAESAHLRFSAPVGYLAELAGHELDAMQIEFSFGETFHIPDRKDNTSGEVAQELLEGRMPVIISRLEHDGLRWTGTVFSRLLEGDVAARGDETLLTEVEWTVMNPGSAARTARMACHFSAPHTAFGYKCSIREPVRPCLRTLGYEKEMVQDALLGIRMAVTPEAWTVVFHRQLPADMLARAALPLGEWNLNLDVLTAACQVPAGETRTLRLLVPYFGAPRAQVEQALQVSFADALTATRAFWGREFAAGGTIETPEPLINDCFDAYLYQAMLATGRKPRSGHWMLKTAPIAYEQLWGAHASIAAFSMDLRGKHVWSRRVFEAFLACQGSIGAEMINLIGDRKSEGYSNHPGFLGNIDGHMAILWAFYHGWTLWAIGQHARLTHDWAWFNGHLDKLLLGCDWIVDQRNRTKRLDVGGARVLSYGLLPAANAFDWGFGHVFWSDCHTYRGFKEIADCLLFLGHPRAAEIAAEAEAYRQDIVAAVTRSRDAAPPVPMDDGTTIPFVPPSVEMLDFFTPDWTYVIAGALNLSWCGLVPPDHELIEQTLTYLNAGRPLGDWLEEKQKYQGWDWGVFAPADEEFLPCTRPTSGRAYLWRHKMTYEPGWNPQTFTFMKRDDIPAFLEHFYSMLSNGGQHVDLRTPVESRDGVPWCQPGQAALLWEMRAMLVREDGETLLLAGTCPRAWYADGQCIAVKGLLTYFGTISFSVESGTRTIRGVVHGNFHTEPRHIKLRLRHPEGRLPKEVRINGRATGQSCDEWILLPAMGGEFIAAY